MGKKGGKRKLKSESQNDAPEKRVKHTKKKTDEHQPSESRQNKDPCGYEIAVLGCPLEEFDWSKPAVRKCTEQTKALFSKLFRKEKLLTHASQQTFTYGQELRVAKFEEEEEEEDDGDDDEGSDGDAQQRREEFGEFGQRATSEQLSAHFSEGRTVQLFSPQRFDDDCFQLLSVLESRFSCLTGASVYLTPPGSQGLAPHWDDVDVFVVQCEGSKRWKVYEPLEVNPLESSGDLPSGVVDGLELQLDLTLRQGEVLYIPRGYVHQASVPEGSDFSTHLTVSTHQRWRMAEFMNELLTLAVNQCDGLNRTIPPRMLSYMGFQHSTSGESGRLRQEFQGMVREDVNALLETCTSELLDLAADSLSMDFMTSRLPPHPNTVTSSEPKQPSGKLVRLVNPNHLRITVENGELMLTSSLANSREAHMHASAAAAGTYPDSDKDDDDDDDDETPPLLEGPVTTTLDLQFAPLLGALQRSYPDYISIDRLPVGDGPEDSVTKALERGAVLMMLSDCGIAEILA